MCTEHPNVAGGGGCDSASSVFTHDCLTRERWLTESTAGGMAKGGWIVLPLPNEAEWG